MTVQKKGSLSPSPEKKMKKREKKKTTQAIHVPFGNRTHAHTSLIFARSRAKAATSSSSFRRFASSIRDIRDSACLCNRSYTGPFLLLISCLLTGLINGRCLFSSLPTSGSLATASARRRAPRADAGRPLPCQGEDTNRVSIHGYVSFACDESSRPGKHMSPTSHGIHSPRPTQQSDKKNNRRTSS